MIVFFQWEHYFIHFIAQTIKAIFKEAKTSLYHWDHPSVIVVQVWKEDGMKCSQTAHHSPATHSIWNPRFRLFFFFQILFSIFYVFSVPFSIISNILIGTLQPLNTDLTLPLNYPLEQKLPGVFLSVNSLSRTHNWVCAIGVPHPMHITFVFHKHYYYSTIISQPYNVSDRISSNVLGKKNYYYFLFLSSIVPYNLFGLLYYEVTFDLLWFMFFAIFFIAPHELHCLKDFFLPQLAALTILYTHAAFFVWSFQVWFLRVF